MIGPVLIVVFLACGLFTGTYPDFWHPKFTSHDKKLDVLALPMRHYPLSVAKPHTLIYRQRAGKPSEVQLQEGNLALAKWLNATPSERIFLIDDIIASGIITGMSSAKATELLGQPQYTEPTIVSPNTYIYLLDDDGFYQELASELRLGTDKEGRVKIVELVITQTLGTPDPNY